MSELMQGQNRLCGEAGIDNGGDLQECKFQRISKNSRVNVRLSRL